MSRYDDLPAVVRYGRGVFLDQVWRYRPGEHVTILGPTGNGKTHLAQALLERTCSPELPAVSLILKPRDATVTKWAKAAGFRKTAAWPPAPPIFGTQKPNGWVVWPRFSYDPARDDPQHYRLFRTAILDSYRKGNRVLFADETVGLQELGLTDELRAVWRQGRSMKCGLWAASQTPTHISPLAYSQAQHLFLGYISDKRAQERFGEISGMDEYLIRHTVKNLKRHEWLYIRQEDRTLCVVEK
ncbi:hypothetical protein [Streptomyces albidoflavus]|uniref:hypothetical protein n=1 Tax=Streptomyces albidoflavus TaxID=1886 RepID=UPI00332084C1